MAKVGNQSKLVTKSTLGREVVNGRCLLGSDEAEDEFGGAPVDCRTTGAAHEQETDRHLARAGLGLGLHRHLVQWQDHLSGFGYRTQISCIHSTSRTMQTQPGLVVDLILEVSSQEKSQGTRYAHYSGNNE